MTASGSDMEFATSTLEFASVRVADSGGRKKNPSTTFVDIPRSGIYEKEAYRNRKQRTRREYGAHDPFMRFNPVSSPSAVDLQFDPAGSDSALGLARDGHRFERGRFARSKDHHHGPGYQPHGPNCNH